MSKRERGLAFSEGGRFESWNLESSVRQVTLGARRPREDGEIALVAALEAEPGIARTRLAPVT